MVLYSKVEASYPGIRQHGLELWPKETCWSHRGGTRRYTSRIIGMGNMDYQHRLKILCFPNLEYHRSRGGYDWSLPRSCRKPILLCVGRIWAFYIYQNLHWADIDTGILSFLCRTVMGCPYKACSSDYRIDLQSMWRHRVWWKNKIVGLQLIAHMQYSFQGSIPI